MIYELDKVDLISSDKNEPSKLCLGISDDVQWEHNIEEHILLLQEKLNNYVTFIINKGYESVVNGDVFDSFAINIYFACVPPQTAINFLQAYQDHLFSDNLPIQLTCEVVEPNYE